MKRRSYLALALSMTLALTSVTAGVPTQAKSVEDMSGAVEVTLSDDYGIVDENATEQKFGTISADEEVTIIVEVDENSLIDEFIADSENELDEYLASDDAVDAQEEITSTVEKVAKKVLKAVENAEIVYEYDTVFTGFSVKTTFGELETIRAIKGVKEAHVSGEYALPESVSDEVNMISSGDMIYASVANEDYGVAGDGIVVGILDTGIDYKHKAFDEKNMRGVSVAYDKYAIANKINNLELDSEKIFESLYSTSYKAEDVYQSLKVPYAYDYCENDLNPIPPTSEDHGTHVAGTIAGNCDEFKGIAYNAQVMSFKVFSDKGGGCTDDVLIAALDDAVKLGVDVINMSLGSDCGFVTDGNDVMQQAYDAVKAAGINLDVSAGNSATAATGSNYGDYNLASNPDESMVGSPSTYDAALSVAAMENTQLNQQTCITGKDAEGNIFEFSYTDTSEGTNNPWSSLAAGEYKYVNCGYGYESDFAKVKDLVKGNIALVSRGDIAFSEKVYYAAVAGAVAVIVYNNTSGTIGMSIDNFYVPAVSIQMEDGQKLLSSIDPATGYGVITIDPTKKSNIPNPAAGTMCSFTSVGPTPSLTLKPEITAPGGNIYSAYYVDENGESVSGLMSGTSMSCPHLAGATALIRQYYKRRFTSLNKVELTNLINAMEMSTATPVIQSVYPSDGTEGSEDLVNYYSPRVQGSGLINIKAALSSQAYLTVKGQERPKAELGYNEEGVYSFETSVVNMGTTEKTFKLSGVVQAELFVSDSSGNAYAYKQEYNMTNDGASITFAGANYNEANQTLTVPANGTASVKVEIKLDKTSENFQLLNQVYNNGFYVEGFVFATPTTGNDKDVELSLPYLGFYGDYTELPLFDASINDYFSGKALPVWDMGNHFVGFDSEFTLGMNYAKYALYGSDDYNANKVYTSVNSDSGLTKNLFPYTYLLTAASEVTYTYTDAKGNVVKTNTYNNIAKSFYHGSLQMVMPAEYFISADTIDEYPVFTGYDAEGNLLPNGKYTLTITAKSVFGGQEQKYVSSFKMDNTAPTVDAYTLEDDNYVYVVVKGKDNEGLQFVELYLNDYATAAGATKVWKADKEGKMTLKLKKSELPAEFNAAGLSVSLYDNAVNCTTVRVADKYDLAAPTFTKATSTKKANISLSWKKVAGATGYKVFRSEKKNGTYKCVATTTKLGYQDKKVKSGKTYYYKVVAYVKDSGVIEKGKYSAIKAVKCK